MDKWNTHRARYLNVADRIPSKPKEEFDLIKRIVDRIEYDLKMEKD